MSDLRNEKKRKKIPNCVSPPPINDAMLAFNKDMQARIEERKQKRESDRNDKLALRAKRIESKKERDERNFRLQEETTKKRFEVDQLREDRILRLQEQSLQLQAEMFRFFQQQAPKRNNDNTGDTLE